MTWPNGDRYDGDWKAGERHGYGSQKYASGEPYAGQWENDEPMEIDKYVSPVPDPKQGRSKKPKWDDGRVYQVIKDGNEQNGKGVMTWPDGDRYDGEWLHGQRHGYGRLDRKNGETYQGNWARNQRNGHGVNLSTNGDEYDGAWVDDQRHGTGKLSRAADGGIDEGRWVNDVYQP
jgi:hypothetical protein